MEQGTPEWFAARCGKVTASRIADVMAKTRSGYGASRKNYMAELVAQRMTNVIPEGFTNAAMQRGIDLEPAARAAYEFYCDQKVIEVGSIDHPNIAMCSASPDGLVGDKGLVEIKCPNTATHIDTLLTDSVPRKYILQMHWQMICTIRDWCDFVSYDDRLPEEMAIWVKRVEYDDELGSAIESEVKKFLSELNETINKLSKKYLEK